MQITATYAIVTPMFLGDAEQNATSIRPSSVKGALRFWWRALNWTRFRQATSCDAAALILLHDEEARLFGGLGEQGGQGKFLLRVKLKGSKLNTQLTKTETSSGHQYLLGQGLYHFANGVLRNAIVGGQLEVILRFRPKTATADCTSISQALFALGLFGGLGSHARKGFGSLAIQQLSGIKAPIPHHKDELKQAIKWLGLNGITCPQPPLTAFSKESRIDLSATDNNPWDLLNTIGKEQQLYRSWGHEDPDDVHRVAGIKAEQKFPDDHKWAQQASSGTCPPQLPKRMIFGLPHNYFFSSTQNKADMAPKTEGRQRRASPLFLHIHQFSDGSAAAIQTLLPAKFLPDGDQVEIKAHGLHHCSRRFNPDWSVITDYLDRFHPRARLL